MKRLKQWSKTSPKTRVQGLTDSPGNSTKHSKNNIYYPEAVSKNRNRRKTSKLVLWGQHYLDPKTRQRPHQKGELRGTWVARSVGRLPSARVMILGSWDRAPHRAPCSAESLLLPLPLPSALPTCALSLSNKYIKIFKRKGELQTNIPDEYGCQNSQQDPS